MKKKFLVVWLLVMSPLLSTFAKKGVDDCFLQKPDDDQTLVFDKADLIPDGEEKALNRKLVDFGRETSNQIVVVVLDDLCGFSPSQYAFKLGDKWGIGQKEEDNGVVLLVKPKRGREMGRVFIAPGRGLEGAIPDLLADRVVEEVIIPYFKNGQYAKGISEGVDDIMLLAIGEYDEEVELPSTSMEGVGLFMLFFLLVIAVIFYASYKRINNYATVNNIPFWTAYNLLNQQAISRNGMPRYTGNRGTYIGGGFPTRGGSGGGGGFKGFGGFGGGSFGGGGAGGSW